ncbi:ABC transporter permease [Pseudobdellovibrio sp. HCB154]|uniref:ABC transporter permease n=1 Tax=Pseudobdellovibrio sp. HCB154 TaxID=3386277 RepID=UPI003916FC47
MSQAETLTTTPQATANLKSIETSQTFFQIVYSQFKEHKAAVVGAYLILFFVLVAVFAPAIEWATGTDSDSQNVFNRYKPPFSKIVASQDARESQIQTFIQANPTDAAAIQQQLLEKNLVQPIRPEDALYDWVNLEKSKAISVIQSLDTSKKDQLVKMVNNFQSFHLFGTDELGRDVLMRLVYGTRVSIGVGILVALASAVIGLIIGSLAGYYGGVIDTVLMRLTDSLLSLPTLPVLVVIAAIDLKKVLGGLVDFANSWFGATAGNFTQEVVNSIFSGGKESIYKLVFILCLFSWMTVARLIRGAILSLREREFILASKTLGATDFTIIVRHMFPNVIAPLLVSVTLGVGDSILFEAALSYLGLGIQPPMPSWGNMLFNAQELIYQAPFLAILPGVLIFLVVVSFNFLGDGLQDAIDPKTVRR